MTSLRFNEIRRLWRAACLALVGAAALSGCGGEPTEGAEDVGDTFTSFEAFEAQTFRDPDTGVYIVDGDIPLATREELHDFYERYALGNALIVNTVSGSVPTWSSAEKINLTYCVSTSFGNNYNVAAKAMLDAGAAWSQAANVRFVHLTEQDSSCNTSNTRVTFDVRPGSNGGTLYAYAFFPGDARAKRSVVIYPSLFGNVAPVTITGVLRHELGHTLGFRHEHTRPQPAKCFEDNNWNPVSSYDALSVMHYPHCNGAQTGDLVLTERDQQGVAALYGRRHGGAKNLAYGKGATQSSSATNAPATLATDGNIDGSFPHKSVTHTNGELSPWWQVDLGSVQSVGDVVIHNRTDGSGERLTNFKLLVSKDNLTWRTISYPGTAGVRVSLPVSEAARYVKIQLTNNGSTQFLHMAEVEVLQARNLARGRATSQSSMEHGGVPERAVDGNTSGNWGSGSTTHTNAELSPWWQVDLGAIQPIGDVVLYNRTDCCADRLSNFKVRVSTDGATWSDYAYPGQAEARTRIEVDRTARFVRVQLTETGVQRFLSLAEVEVLAGRNLARGKVATQSTEGAPASRAIDGLTNGVYAAGSVTHTAEFVENTPWWQVDLGSAQPVGEVVLYNRTDCCAERLSNFKLRLSTNGTNWTDYPYPGAAAPLTTMIANQTARYVRVQLNDIGATRPLSLAEVEVLAARNLGLAMPATQSSTYLHQGVGAVASRAVDGNTDGDFFHLSVSHTEQDAQSWWQVDLGGLQPIGDVVLWNRTDGASDRLSNFNVMLSEDGTTFTSFAFPGTAGERTSFLSRLVGRYVKVRLNQQNNLQLAEVEVNLNH